jgi:hypothetical protein
MESKLSSLSRNHVSTKDVSDLRIKNLENRMNQKQKENEILGLRLRYMRQTADVLMRQKTFLRDTLTKSKTELE